MVWGVNCAEMSSKKKEKKSVLESVKIDGGVVDLVRDRKKTHFTPIGKFFEIAALEKLQKEKK